VDAVLAGSGFSAAYRVSEQAFMHPGRSADVLVGGQVVGVIGALHPRLNKVLDLPGDVYAFELDLSALPQRQLPKASTVSRFPSVRRDLALLVPESVSWGEIEQCIRAALGARLHSVTVFDQYHGSGLQPGTKSLAMGLILHDISRTLNDLEVEQSVSDVLEKLGKDCQAVLRG
jgi:phenylalanyl-tRNA synthetase beta chain